MAELQPTQISEIFSHENEKCQSDMDIFRHVKEKYKSSEIDIAVSDIDVNSRLICLDALNKIAQVQDHNIEDGIDKIIANLREKDEILPSHLEKINIMAENYLFAEKNIEELYNHYEARTGSKLGSDEFNAFLIQKIISERAENYTPLGDIEVRYLPLGLALLIDNEKDFEAITGWPTGEMKSDQKYNARGVHFTLNHKLPVSVAYTSGLNKQSIEHTIDHETNHSLFNLNKRTSFYRVEIDRKIDSRDSLRTLLKEIDDLSNARRLLGIFKKTEPLNPELKQKLQGEINQFLRNYIETEIIEESLAEGGGNIHQVYYSRFQAQALRVLWRLAGDKKITSTIVKEILNDTYNFDPIRDDQVLDSNYMKLPPHINPVAIGDNFKENIKAPSELFDKMDSLNLQKAKDELIRYFFLDDVYNWKSLADITKNYFEKFVESNVDEINQFEKEIELLFKNVKIGETNLHEKAHARIKYLEWGDNELIDTIKLLGGQEASDKYYDLYRRYKHEKPLAGYTLENELSKSKMDNYHTDKLAAIEWFKNKLPDWLEEVKKW